MSPKVIYAPKGKAREYAELALNLYRGCGHGCTYCYAPQICHISRNLFSAPAWPHPLGPQDGSLSAEPLLKRLAKDAAALAGDPRRILLSFTSDPYQPAEKEYRLTRQAMIILVNHGLSFSILTKGGSWGVERDYALLTEAHCDYPHSRPASWGATLTFCTGMDSLKWEPGAASPMDRISSLYLAKKYGLHTWVSFEPVLDPAQVYLLLEMTHEFVDHYKVGKLNYHPWAKTIDWRRFKGEIEGRLTKLGKSYYLKKDLLEAAA